MTTTEFINKSSIIHNNKYTYGSTIFTKTSEKTIITCPTHGDFYQVANSHLRGHGCKKCSDSTNHNMELHKQTFLSKVTDKFPELDLSSIVWISTTTPIEVQCPIHGPFTIGPNALLHKNCKGCPQCVKKQKAIENAIAFKTKAQQVHGDIYDYSLITHIVNMNNTIPIICKLHGVFNQTASNHLKGSKCHTCMNIERGYKQRYTRLGTSASLYLVYFKEYNLYKLGVTVSLKARFNGEPVKPEILFTKDYAHEAQAYLVETQLFRQFYKFRYVGENVLHRKGNSELLTSNILEDLIPSVETIENTEEYRTLTGSE